MRLRRALRLRRLKQSSIKADVRYQKTKTYPNNFGGSVRAKFSRFFLTLLLIRQKPFRIRIEQKTKSRKPHRIVAETARFALTEQVRWTGFLRGKLEHLKEISKRRREYLVKTRNLSPFRADFQMSGFPAGATRFHCASPREIVLERR